MMDKIMSLFEARTRAIREMLEASGATISATETHVGIGEKIKINRSVSDELDAHGYCSMIDPYDIFLKQGTRLLIHEKYADGLFGSMVTHTMVHLPDEELIMSYEFKVDELSEDYHRTKVRDYRAQIDELDKLIKKEMIEYIKQSGIKIDATVSWMMMDKDGLECENTYIGIEPSLYVRDVMPSQKLDGIEGNTSVTTTYENTIAGWLPTQCDFDEFTRIECKTVADKIGTHLMHEHWLYDFTLYKPVEEHFESLTDLVKHYNHDMMIGDDETGLWTSEQQYTAEVFGARCY